MRERARKGTLKDFEKKTGISANQICAYINGRAEMSKKRSILFEKASKELGYDTTVFNAANWMFCPEKIKSALAA